MKINLEYLEQDIKNKLFEKKKEINLDAAKLVEEQQVILRSHFERNLISELEVCKSEADKDTVQLLKECLTHLKIKTKYSSRIRPIQTNTCLKNTKQK